jgi:hypothetical protein
MIQPIGEDGRSAFERLAWAAVGPPLYYCEHCLRAVKVTGTDNPTVTRNCGHTDAKIIAPRKAILMGEGVAASPATKLKIMGMQLKSTLTGRT